MFNCEIHVNSAVTKFAATTVESVRPVCRLLMAPFHLNRMVEMNLSSRSVFSEYVAEPAWLAEQLAELLATLERSTSTVKSTV